MENPFKSKTNEKSEEVTDEIKNENIENSSEESSSGENEKPVEEAENNELQKKYDELNNQYIRLAADFDNFRKRQIQEKEDLLKYGASNTIKSLIEVLDNFDRGLKAIETVEDCDKVKECYNLAYKNFNDVLAKLGLEVIKAEGEIFNPEFHEAVMQTPSEDVPDQTIIAELQKGYKLGDKVLRPTLVNVATK